MLTYFLEFCDKHVLGSQEVITYTKRWTGHPLSSFYPSHFIAFVRKKIACHHRYILFVTSD
jgi:hypothetical protein